MSEETSTTTDDHQSRRSRRINGLLAAMVAIYGILTAATAYSASIAAGHSDENFVKGLAHLTDANFFYTEGSRTVSYDTWLVDQLIINEQFGVAENLIDYFEGQLSVEAQISLEEDDDLFGDTYFENIYATGNEYQTLADSSFELAERWGERGDLYQLYVTIMAVGLSFAAWASLMERLTMPKWLFTIMSTITLVISLIAVIGTGMLSEPLPRLAEEATGEVFDEEFSEDEFLDDEFMDEEEFMDDEFVEEEFDE